MVPVGSTEILTENSSRRVLEKYGVVQNNYILTRTLEETLRAVNDLRYPLVMKVVSEKIVHKSDFGGVQVNLMNKMDVQEAYQKIYANASANGVSHGEIDGVLVQEMVAGIEEMLIGVKKDSTFGMTFLIGLGGVLVELMQDVSLGICPLSEEDIYRMLKNLKGFPLLNGYRGRKKADVPAFVQTIKKVQELVLTEPGIKEMDLNPVIVQELGSGCSTVDARIIMEK